MASRAPRLIHITPLRDLPAPMSEQDYAECLQLCRALKKMEYVTARLGSPDEDFSALLRYEGPTPREYWAKWLSAQIGHVNCHDFAWLARISGIDKHHREIRFVPRPDRLDVDLAAQALRSAPGQLVRYIVLRVVTPLIKETVTLPRRH